MAEASYVAIQMSCRCLNMCDFEGKGILHSLRHSKKAKACFFTMQTGEISIPPLEITATMIGFTVIRSLPDHKYGINLVTNC
jgi:hypothetical protein